MRERQCSSLKAPKGRAALEAAAGVTWHCFHCSILHPPGQACWRGPETPALLAWVALIALPPLPARVANSSLPCCCYRSHSWFPQELLLVQKAQASYVFACSWTIIPCTTEILLYLVVGYTPLDIIVLKIRASAQTTSRLETWKRYFEGILNVTKNHERCLRSHCWFLKRLKHLISILVSNY